jgi:hypothetical protein
MYMGLLCIGCAGSTLIYVSIDSGISRGDNTPWVSRYLRCRLQFPGNVSCELFSVGMLLYLVQILQIQEIHRAVYHIMASSILPNRCFPMGAWYPYASCLLGSRRA